jgi:uncharacterized SAM-binding protein YcdF (DUF218 family)
MTYAAIVLGKEYRRFDGKPVLSMEAKMTAIAAGEMYRCGAVSMLIFTGGKTAGPEYPSEAETMALYCMRRYPEIPPEAIIIEGVAFDTISNARMVRDILRKNGSRAALLISRNYHLPRAEEIFLREGVVTVGINAEAAYAHRSSRHSTLANAYTGSLYYRILRVKEFLLRFQLAVDPEARIQRFITKRLRFAK